MKTALIFIACLCLLGVSSERFNSEPNVHDVITYLHKTTTERVKGLNDVQLGSEENQEWVSFTKRGVDEIYCDVMGMTPEYYKEHVKPHNYNIIKSIFPRERVSINISRKGSPLYAGNVHDLTKFKYDHKKKWVFLLHGMRGPEVMREIEEIFKKEDVYLAYPDYHVGTHKLIIYTFSVLNLNTLVDMLKVEVIDKLEIDSDRLNYIGFNYGSQVAGLLGKKTRADRVVGLEPVLPFFEWYWGVNNLDRTSGDHVISLYTSFTAPTFRHTHTCLELNDPEMPYLGCPFNIFPECNNRHALKVFTKIFNNHFLLFNETIREGYVQVLDLDFKLLNGVYNFRQKKGMDKNSPEPLLLR